MADQYTRTIKDSPIPSKLQVTLEGGPFHGQILWDWYTETRGSRWLLRPMLDRPFGGIDLADPLSSAFAYALNVRTARYELKRWNEAGTAGIAECVDDGKPKCKDAGTCMKMEARMDELKFTYPSSLRVTRTKSCEACGRPLAFEVQQRS